MQAKNSKDAAKRKEGEKWLEIRRQIETWLRNPRARSINIGSASKKVVVGPPRNAELGSDFENVADEALDLALEKTLNPVVAAGRKLADWRRVRARQRGKIEEMGESIAVATMAQEASGARCVRLKNEHALKQATVDYCEREYKRFTGRDWDPDADWVGRFKSGLPQKDHDLEERSRAALIKMRDALTQFRESVQEVRSIGEEVRSGPIALPQPDYETAHMITWEEEEATGGPLTNWLVRGVDPKTRMDPALNWFIGDFPVSNTLSDLLKAIPKDVATLRVDGTALELVRERVAYFWPAQKALMAEISALARGDEDEARRADAELGSPHRAGTTELAIVWILLGGWPELTIPAKGKLPSEAVKSAAKGFEKSNTEVERVIANYERELEK
jgi:hypothetical protein